MSEKPRYLTGLENCGLHKRTPYGITNVSMTQFSIARYSGGCTFNGDHYTYMFTTDELVRTDVLKWMKRVGVKTAKQKQDNLL